MALRKGNFKGRKKGSKDKKKRRRRKGLIGAAIGGSIAALPVAYYLNDAKQGEIRATSEKTIKKKYPSGGIDIGSKKYWNEELPKANLEARKIVNAKRAKVLGVNISANARNIGLVAGAGLLGAGLGYGVSKLIRDKETKPRKKKESAWKDTAKIIGVGLGGAVIGGAVLGLAMKNRATKKAIASLNQKRRQVVRGIDPSKDFTNELLNVKDKVYNESDNLALQLEDLMKPLSDEDKAFLKADGFYSDKDLDIKMPDLKPTKKKVVKNEFLSKLSKQERRDDIRKAGVLGVGIGASTVGLGSAGVYSLVRNKNRKSKNKRNP